LCRTDNARDQARGGAEQVNAEPISGGAALPVEVPRGFEEAFGCLVLEGYGLSETSPVASFNHLGRERKPGSIGMPIRGVQMRVVDSGDHEVPQGEVGEIVICGPNVMKGYWHRPKATAEALRGGWFRTGDLARVDEDGYFFIVDRKFAACQERGDLVPDQIVFDVLTRPWSPRPPRWTASPSAPAPAARPGRSACWPVPGRSWSRTATPRALPIFAIGTDRLNAATQAARQKM